MKGHFMRTSILFLLSLIFLMPSVAANGQNLTATCEPITASNGENLEAFQTLDYVGIDGIHWSPSGEFLALNSPTGVQLLETDNFTLVSTVPANTRFMQFQFSPINPYLAITETDVKLWNLTTQTNRQFADFPDSNLSGGVHAPAFSHGGNQLAAIIGENNVRMWDTQSGEQTYELEIEGFEFGDYLAFTPDDSELIFASTQLILVLDIATPQILRSFDVSSLQPIVRSIIFDVGLSPSGNVLAVVSGFASGSNTYLTFLDTENLEILGSQFEYVNGQRVAFSPDGSLLAMNSGNSVDVWRLDDEVLSWRDQRNLLIELHGHESDPYELAFSSDGRFIASVSRLEEEGVPTFQEHTTIIVWGVCSG
jgi:WD40 repeat protein